MHAEGPLQQVLCKQMVLIQSACKLIAMSLYSLVCGHFSQPVAWGCMFSWPADPANHTGTSLFSHRNHQRRSIRPQPPELCSQLLLCTSVASSAGTCDNAAQSFSILDFCCVAGPTGLPGMGEAGGHEDGPWCAYSTLLTTARDTRALTQGYADQPGKRSFLKTCTLL